VYVEKNRRVGEGKSRGGNKENRRAGGGGRGGREEEKSRNAASNVTAILRGSSVRPSVRPSAQRRVQRRLQQGKEGTIINDHRLPLESWGSCWASDASPSLSVSLSLSLYQSLSLTPRRLKARHPLWIRARVFLYLRERGSVCGCFPLTNTTLMDIIDYVTIKRYLLKKYGDST